MQQYLLSLLIFTPLGAALIALFIPSVLERYFRILFAAASIAQIVFLVQLLLAYEPSVSLQFIEQKTWISLDLGTWGLLKAEYFVAVDGLNIALVSLAVLVMAIAGLASWSITRNVKGYFILLLILNAAIIGTFTALDFLLFYVFFEFKL
jgi:NADH-quinone oxidoreductase subunit M